MMKRSPFKAHQIIRSSPPRRKRYESYRETLRADFHGRCAYCNLLDIRITTPFEIDHFIPKAIFKDIKPELLNDYKNLVYSCKKCNLAKGSQFEGDITAPIPENALFYEPTKVDYNTVFYRNEYGMICSDDEKGRRMIEALKLYRGIHALGWLCEMIDDMTERIQKRLDTVDDSEAKERLQRSFNKLNGQYRVLSKLFVGLYREDPLIEQVYSDKN